MSWERQSIGPDWTDIRRTLRSLEQLHECEVTLLMSPDGPHEGTGIVVRALALSAKPRNGLKQAELSVSLTWPNASNRLMESAVYRLLMQLDHELLTKWWAQAELTPT